MSSSTTIHDSSPSGKDIVFTFSTLHDGLPLDFDDSPIFQFDVMDGSAGGRFDQDSSKLVTSITSAGDPDLITLDPDNQKVSVVVPWSKEPVFDGGVARGISQYDPAFNGEVYVYLTISSPTEATSVAGSQLTRSVRNRDNTANIYREPYKDRKKDELIQQGLVPFDGGGDGPTIGDDPCFGVITPPGEQVECIQDTSRIDVKVVKAEYLSGCPSITDPYRAKLILHNFWGCRDACSDVPGGADPDACRKATIVYSVRAWKPTNEGAFVNSECPPDDFQPPDYIAAGSFRVKPCPNGINGINLPQQVELAPVGSDGVSIKEGIPAFPFGSRVRIDFSEPRTDSNMPLGQCLEEVFCGKPCCCPRIGFLEVEHPSTDDYPWKVPSTLADGSSCCEGCNCTSGQCTPPYSTCQVMYKGYRNTCSSNPYGIPTFLETCDPDLYKVFWSDSDIFPCGKSLQFWLRFQDIE